MRLLWLYHGSYQYTPCQPSQWALLAGEERNLDHGVFRPEKSKSLIWKTFDGEKSKKWKKTKKSKSRKLFDFLTFCVFSRQRIPPALRRISSGLFTPVCVPFDRLCGAHRAPWSPRNVFAGPCVAGYTLRIVNTLYLDDISRMYACIYIYVYIKEIYVVPARVVDGCCMRGCYHLTNWDAQGKPICLRRSAKPISPVDPCCQVWPRLPENFGMRFSRFYFWKMHHTCNEDHVGILPFPL